MKHLNIATLCLFLTSAGCATQAVAQPPFGGTDLYGSKRVSVEEVKRTHGEKIEEAVMATDPERFVQLSKEVAASIREKYGFAHTELSVLTYFEPRARYLTIDVVEIPDIASRMPFLPAPTGTFEDPEGLIALWKEYETIGFDLLHKGELKIPKKCPVWHCTFGFEHEKLKKYGPIFDERVPRQRDRLVEILRSDKDAYKRGMASYLLAHLPDVRDVAKLQEPSIFDGHSFPRNSVIRVFSGILEKDRTIEVPLDPFLKAIDFPATTDRNKAGAVLTLLSENPRHHARIAREAGPSLVRMLRLQQPNNHDPAFQILKNVSGLTYGERDYAAWDAWLANELRPSPGPAAGAR